jgi:type II secretory pathway pseudopilin PulG
MKTKPKQRGFTLLLRAGAGFTLIELLLVIGVIIILAGIAIPNFYKAKERALTKEAIANLKLIAAAEKVYRMEIGVYYNPGGATAEKKIANINDSLRLYFTNVINWEYTITAATADTFTATADRGSCTFTVTESGDPTDNGACP